MTCERCGKEFTEDYRKWPKGPVRFCSRECANSRAWTDEDKEKKSLSAKKSFKVENANKKRRIWPEKRFCVVCGTRITKKSSYCKKCYVSNNKEFIEAVKKNGGYREKSGRGKTGYYKGHYCASTWELAFLIYHLENKIPIKRNTEKFPYVKKDGTSSFYIPDFLVINSFVEIKGPQDKNWEEKKKFFPYELKSIEKNDINFYINFVKERFNINNLFSLYDDIKENKCLECGKVLYKYNKTGYCRKHVYIYRNKQGPVD